MNCTYLHRPSLKIVGFTDKARFNAAPVLYGDLATFHRVKFGEAAEANKESINGIVVRAMNQQQSLRMIHWNQLKSKHSYGIYQDTRNRI